MAVLSKGDPRCPRRRISRGVSTRAFLASRPSSLPQFPHQIPGPWCEGHPCTRRPTALVQGCRMLSSPPLPSQPRSQPRPRSAGQMPTSRLGPRSVGQSWGRGQEGSTPAQPLLWGSSPGQLPRGGHSWRGCQILTA